MMLLFDVFTAIIFCDKINIPSPFVLFCSFPVAEDLMCCVLSAEFLSVEDFPKHIKSLVQKEKESEEQEKRQREIERNTCKVHIFGFIKMNVLSL